MSGQALQQIRRRFSDAYRARDYAASAQVAAEGAALAVQLGDAATQTRMLLWQGESHWQRKETDAATAALEQAARAGPDADAIDVFSAHSTLISIALIERPLAEIEQRLDHARELLRRPGLERAGHMLDLNAGELAARRGDWPTARLHFERAYEQQAGDSGQPRFTPASYLIKLVEASFMLGDRPAVARWCERLSVSKPEIEGDRLRAEQARLIAYRAGIPGPAGARGDAASTARRLMCWLEEIEGYRSDYARDAFHVLLLQGDWLSVETWLDYPGLNDDPLIRGDLHLARARSELELPPVDLDWPERTEQVERPARQARRRLRAEADLEAAHDYYLSQSDWAEREDRRLQTDAHQHRLGARRRWTEALREALAEPN